MRLTECTTCTNDVMIVEMNNNNHVIVGYNANNGKFEKEIFLCCVAVDCTCMHSIHICRYL